ncbi:hypothetical protein [Rheinheimera hassiensis]|uniref:hypothetical protein n=1 Tax=Rheinheimera hassiensis TaxID=1193627 RepID=UPI001F06AE14|nr:hypothetical protein [Rheinheimera hassiensis]
MRFICILLILLPTISFATEYTPDSAAELRAQYQLLLELKAEDAITEAVFNEKSESIKQQAYSRYQTSLEDMPSASATEQRIDSFTSALYSISALLLLALVAKIMSYFPAILNEALVYVASTVTLLVFHQEYVVLVAGFSLAGVLAYSINSRIEDSGTARRWTGWLLMLVLGILAWCFDNSVFGVCSVIAFVYSLGFVILITPGMIAVGVNEARITVVLRLAFACMLLTLLAWLIFYTNWLSALMPVRQTLHAFELGMLTVLPLAYFTALGYLSFFLLKHRFWLRFIAELAALISGLAVIIIALLYQLDTMFWVGAVFMLWNLMDKFHELVYKRVSFTAACTLFAVIFGGSAAIIKSNMAIIMPHLAFLNL